MTPLMFIYKAMRKAWLLLLCNPFYHIVTIFMMRGNAVRYGSFSTNGIPIISVDRKKSKIIMGENLRMNNGNAGNWIGFSARCSLVALDEATIRIGGNVGMSQTAICAVGADITIGNYTLLGGGVKIYSSDFHSLNYMDRRDHKEADCQNRNSTPVVIGDDCIIMDTDAHSLDFNIRRSIEKGKQGYGIDGLAVATAPKRVKWMKRFAIT